jgi:hypothetical protein
MWWKAVCDEHKEMCDIFVNNIRATSVLLMRHSDAINDWMWSHRGCKLRLIYDDHDLDECFNAGIKSVVDFSKSPPSEPFGTLTWDGFGVRADFICTCGAKVYGDIGCTTEHDKVKCDECGRVWQIPLVVRPYEKKETSP